MPQDVERPLCETSLPISVTELAARKCDRSGFLTIDSEPGYKVGLDGNQTVTACFGMTSLHFDLRRLQMDVLPIQRRGLRRSNTRKRTDRDIGHQLGRTLLQK